jgi:hypothetical protein
VAYPSHPTIDAQRGSVPGPRARLDFDGDGKTDWAVTRPEFPTGDGGGMYWHILNGAGYTGLQWGASASDIQTPGDFDGDGKADIAVFRFGENTFYARLSSTGALLAQTLATVGPDPRVVADYDGDGKDDMAVWAQIGGIWWIKRSSDGSIVTTQFGQLGDKAAAGDYDGDGRADLAVVRLVGGTAYYFIQQSTAGFTVQQWGQFVDRIIPASDYDGDGKTDLAVVRLEGATYRHYIRRSSDGGMIVQVWGDTSYVQPGDYDGDGKTDIAVYRDVPGGWSVFYVLKSSDGAMLAQPWGLLSDNAFANVIVRLL